MVHDLYLMSLSGLLGVMDWLTVLLFLGMAAVYFLAPVAGYMVASRGRIVPALWLLVLKMVVGVVRTGAISLLMLEADGSSRGSQMPIDLFSVRFGLQVGLPVLEMTAVATAMALFVLGLQSLTRRPELPREPPAPVS